MIAIHLIIQCSCQSAFTSLGIYGDKLKLTLSIKSDGGHSIFSSAESSPTLIETWQETTDSEGTSSGGVYSNSIDEPAVVGCCVIGVAS